MRKVTLTVGTGSQAIVATNFDPYLSKTILLTDTNWEDIPARERQSWQKLNGDGEIFSDFSQILSQRIEATFTAKWETGDVREFRQKMAYWQAYTGKFSVTYKIEMNGNTEVETLVNCIMVDKVLYKPKGNDAVASIAFKGESPWKSLTINNGNPVDTL